MSKLGVYIGRFQPFHKGHQYVIDQMQKEVDEILVLVGSSNLRRSIKNPFDFDLLVSAITSYITIPSVVLPLNDYIYNDTRWVTQVRGIVEGECLEDTEVVLYGHSKDESSFYLKMFPEWGFQEVDNFQEINATQIRDSYFENGIISPMVENPVMRSIMQKFKKTTEYKNLVGEWEYYNVEEVEKFREYPYKDTLGFMCSDAVVVCAGHVLLVQRKNNPGKDCWALPGGFKNSKETFLAGALRELREETNLRVPVKVLQGSIKGNMVFDSPSRSLGIPRVSSAFFFEIDTDADGKLPRVSPADDAADAFWMPLTQVQSNKMFDDHFDIIEYFTKGAL